MSFWKSIDPRNWFKGGAGGGPPKGKGNSAFILHDSAVSTIANVLASGQPEGHVFSNITENFTESVGSTPGGSNLNFFDPKQMFKPRESFMNALREWHFNQPDQQMFAVVMMLPPVMLADGYQMADYTLMQLDEFPEMGADLAIARGMQRPYQYASGCLFAQGANIPGESVAATWKSPDPETAGGLIGFPYLGTRKPFTNLSIMFRETNVSFIDFVIRPWMVMASHLGLAERPPSDTLGVKADIYIIQFGKSGVALKQGANPIQPNASTQSEYLENVVPLLPRKIWRFQDCVPVNVPPSSIKYTGSKGEFGSSNIEFIYSKYEVHLPSHYLDQAENVSVAVDKSYNSPSSQSRQSTQDFEPAPVESVEGALTKKERAYDASKRAGADPASPD
jgi:hypothetical protein